MDTDGAGRLGPVVVNHRRADYILERGMWKAVCRGCRWTVESGDRQRAAVLFRSHNKQMESSVRQPPPLAVLAGAVDLIDLTDHPRVEQDQETA